ncbi:MAG TPA: RNA-binding domain-containing protein [Anaerolineae bacterium]|nr:RNA-binding domain-containing protein [Anaerolineae bacterium]
MAQRKKRDAQPQRQWRRMDVHLHTPASIDFQEPSITFLDILKKAEARSIDLVAFTDHNSVAGYARFLQEIDQLKWLEKLKRILPEEKRQLEEYERLRKKILVLPGFEFTATFGFHILGIFPETTPVRVIEHVLLNLNVPTEKLDQGATECGATSDVLTAYRLIDEAGGLAIAAHVNSSHGVAMRGLDFGGQTKIAYTQDAHLHALEVTDLDSKSKRSTATFFNGTKPEYPRRMHCIQSSDSHRLNRDPKNAKNLGAFDRVTEVLLPELSFAVLKQVFLGNDFALTRPYRGKASEPYDVVKAAREVGANIVQSFHEGHSQRGGKLRAIVMDICAFANTNGGTIYVGVPADPHKAPIGVAAPKSAIEAIRKAVQKQITPPIEITFATHDVSKLKVLQINVPRGDDLPYAIDENKIYVRNESETVQAVRDEIVNIVKKQTMAEAEQKPKKHGKPGKAQPPIEPPQPIEPGEPIGSAPTPQVAVPQIAPPKVGVEIVDSTTRGGIAYHTVRDLRNGSVVRNVTRKSARKLWHYAITQYEQHPAEKADIKWLGHLGLLGTSKRAGVQRYDFVQRLPDGKLCTYYGVTEDGIHGEWQKVAELAPVSADDGLSETVVDVADLTENQTPA